jgi:hypothetical protein
MPALAGVGSGDVQVESNNRAERAEIAGILVPRTAEMSADIYDLIVEKIPQLRADRGVLALLDASVSEIVAT